MSVRSRLGRKDAFQFSWVGPHFSFQQHNSRVVLHFSYERCSVLNSLDPILFLSSTATPVLVSFADEQLSPHQDANELNTCNLRVYTVEKKRGEMLGGET